MKRVNQELTSEVQSLRENSESKDRLHMEAINQLAEEIAEQKVHMAQMLSMGSATVSKFL